MSITGDNKVAVAFVVVGLVPPVASEWGSIGSPGRVRDDQPGRAGGHRRGRHAGKVKTPAREVAARR